MLRTGECVAAQFDCSQLSTIPEGQVACDATSGNLYTACIVGQPVALACGAGTKCTSGSLNCYTEPVDGAACGGSAVCYPGLHCTQPNASGAACDQPAGTLACNNTDVLAVCNNADTGVACVKGAVWWWNNLTSWGGSCTNNHVNLPIGGVCIPGLADCTRGLECYRSVYDIAGVCRTPQPNAPPECTLTGQVSTGRSCTYAWNSCRDGKQYGIGCRAQNVGGQVVTLCECSVNGTVVESFGGSEICNVATLDDLDAKSQMSCGWDVSTRDSTPR